MKRTLISIILLGLTILTVGCTGSAETNTHQIGSYVKYPFGIFTISGFKREGDKFYFSYEIDPSQSEPLKITLNDLSYYVGDDSTKIDSITIPLDGKLYQGIYTITTDKATDINGIGLEYEDQFAKWDFSTISVSGGDIDYIDNQLANESATLAGQDQSKSNEQDELEAQKQELENQQQELENQRNLLESQRQQESAQQTQNQITAQEQSSLNNAWNVIDNYGKSLYPNGFTLQDRLIEEKNSDGSWFLSALCEVIEPDGEIVETYCDVTVRGSGQTWTIEEFFVDDFV